MFVCCECCVLSGRGLCDELITHPEESYRLWCVVMCDLETSRLRRPWPVLSRSATIKKMQLYTVYLYLETALHVSGGTSSHHQERIQLYLQHPVFVRLLPAAKAAGSSNGVTNTRCSFKTSAVHYRNLWLFRIKFILRRHGKHGVVYSIWSVMRWTWEKGKNCGKLLR
jgi:hypothetical protein